ncbi:hypothetical protein Hanom_Chr13g01192651 [Helianthus anomalus]
MFSFCSVRSDLCFYCNFASIMFIEFFFMFDGLSFFLPYFAYTYSIFFLRFLQH